MFPGVVVQHSTDRKIIGTILLVEDDNNFAEFLLHCAFKWEPVHVELVADGEAALEYAQKHKVDLVVLGSQAKTSSKNGSEICQYLLRKIFLRNL